MRLPRVRFTVRRLMVAMAIVGLLVGLMMRHLHFRRMADYHDSRVVESFEIGRPPREPGSLESAPASITVYNHFGRLVGRAGKTRDGLKRLMSLSDWHEVMRRKFEYAARRPWLPVEPDPPEPE
jgi:hypothetical protein